MVTSLVLPAVRRGDISSDRLQAFEAIERRFGWQARIPPVVVALTGFYMTHRLDLWGRFRLEKPANGSIGSPTIASARFPNGSCWA